MKRLEREINKGKNLEESLPEFADKMLSIYNNLSYVRLSMNYYVYYGMLKDEKSGDNNLTKLTNSFNEIVKRLMADDVSEKITDELISQTADIRGAAINTLTAITAYVDLFNLYEYCLNRVEYRFKDGAEFLKSSDEEITDEIIAYVMSDKDNIVINSKIKEMVSQLPIRMTKDKLFEFIKNGFKAYNGAEAADFDEYVDMLKKSASIEKSQYSELLPDFVRETCEELSCTSFADITGEQYEALRLKLHDVAKKLYELMDLYVNFSSAISDAYAIAFIKKHKLEDERDALHCREIIAKVTDMFDEGISDEAYEDAEDMFVELEGRQEDLLAMTDKYDYITELALENYKNKLASLNLENDYDTLQRVKLISSGSLFTDFKDKSSITADEAHIDEVTECFIAELREFFKGHERLVNKAVMSQILSSLPQPFDNALDFKNYVINSLKQCSDNAEKAAAVQLIRQIIDEDMYEVV